MITYFKGGIDIFLQNTSVTENLPLFRDRMGVETDASVSTTQTKNNQQS